MIPSPTAILFDLDGTLLDTAQDMACALNQVRNLYQLPDLPLELVRPIAGQGTRALLKLGFGITDEAQFLLLREQFLTFYQKNCAETAYFFPNVQKVLTHLEENNILWGIVTNKPQRFAQEILHKLELARRAACVIYGDTLPHAKPHPAPIHHACQLIQKNPAHCLYVGDMETDVIASKAAGMPAMVALYGYFDSHEDPYRWGADAYIKQPLDIIDWLEQKIRASCQ
jgi:phosphoglycolate phosphatase